MDTIVEDLGLTLTKVLPKSEKRQTPFITYLSLDGVSWGLEPFTSSFDPSRKYCHSYYTVKTIDRIITLVTSGLLPLLFDVKWWSVL